MGRFKSLRARLLLLVAAAMVPAFVLLGYMGLVQREQAAMSAEKDALNLVRMAAREHQLLIASTRQLLIGAARLPEVRPGQSASCNRVLAELRAAFPFYANLGAATPDGRVYCSAVPLQEPVNIADRSYFRRAVGSRAFAVGDYQIGRITGTSGINLGYPVYDGGNEPIAVVYAALDLSWLEHLTARVELPPGSSVTLTDSAGTILAHQPNAHRWVGKRPAASPLMRTLLSRPGEGTAELRGLDGETKLYAFAPLHHESDASAYVSVGIPTSVAFAPVRTAFARSIALLLVAALLALFAAWVGVNHFVLRRLRALNSAVRRLAAGDMNARTGLAHANGEFGQLARHFDDMAAALRRVTRALKTLSAGNRTLVRATEEQALLESMCRVIVEVGGYPLAWVGYAEDDDSRSIRPVAQAGYQGGLEALTQVLGRVSWGDDERGRGPGATAIRTGETCVIRNVLSDPRLAAWRAETERHGHAAAAGFPLPVGGRIIGTLVLYARDVDAFDAEEVTLLEEAAEDLAFGIASLRTRAAHEQAHRTIQQLAYYDSLTGLPNHAQFEERLKALLAGRERPELALLLLGVNRFREINEALGFNEGDALLRALGGRVREAVGEAGLVARVRGDEFGVLLHPGGAAEAEQTARRILAALDAPFVLGGIAVDVSVAIGIALSPQHGTDGQDLIRCADVAMQLVKRSGAGYAFHAAEHNRDATRRLVMARELRTAIETGQLVLYYQPKVFVAAGEVCGLEALVRWRHSERGLVPPDEFIPLAEHTGLIRPLTDWAVAEALRQSCAWRRAGLALPVAVNLSVRNLQDPELPERVQRVMRQSGADGSWLEFEITESAIMDDPERALQTLRALDRLGIALYIDDFGTGYSSLGYLQRLPVDAIKIDKSFVKHMLDDADSSVIVRSTITLAHDLGIEAVAEGVESQAMWDALAGKGCDVVQGYFISRPQPGDQCQAWLASAPWPIGAARPRTRGARAEARRAAAPTRSGRRL